MKPEALTDDELEEIALAMRSAGWRWPVTMRDVSPHDVQAFWLHTTQTLANRKSRQADGDG